MERLAKINKDLFNITKLAYLICSNDVCTNNSLAIMLTLLQCSCFIVLQMSMKELSVLPSKWFS